MPKFKMFQVDAFAERVFTGNPAAVLVVDEWLSEHLMQAIAAENNLAETAFVRRQGAGFELRWFTPVQEVAFCGHATLATAHVLATHYGVAGEITFATRKVGTLKVRPDAGGYTLDLPSLAPEPLEPMPDLLRDLFPRECADAFRNFENLFVVLASEAELRAYVPDSPRIALLRHMGLCITTPADAGGNIDFLSRYFAPSAGIPEDPVTGSTHATLVPYWSKRLGRQRLQAYQASQRGGHLACRLAGDRVWLTGRAVTFMEACIDVPG